MPFIVSWPGHLAANSKCDEPIISIDILPTICAAVGIDLPQDRIYDGLNMLPALKGESSSPLHDNLFFDGDDGYWSVRAGDWKLVLNPQEKLELYNLHDDVGETTDLSQKYPQKVQELNVTYQSWRHEMAPRIQRAN